MNECYAFKPSLFPTSQFEIQYMNAIGSSPDALRFTSGAEEFLAFSSVHWDWIWNACIPMNRLFQPIISFPHMLLHFYLWLVSEKSTLIIFMYKI